jgi:hypothetical protein
LQKKKKKKKKKKKSGSGTVAVAQWHPHCGRRNPDGTERYFTVKSAVFNHLRVFIYIYIRITIKNIYKKVSIPHYFTIYNNKST